MKLIYKLKSKIFDFKQRCQRFKRGYADIDVWNMNEWFLKTTHNMLKELDRTRHGYPSDLTDESWSKILNEMISAFEVAAKNPDDNNEYWDKVEIEVFTKDGGELTLSTSDDEVWDKYRARADELEKAQQEAKKKALKLFVKYFDNLWD